MFCAKCGKELKEDAKFCNACGTPTRLSRSQQPPATGAPQPTGAATQPPPATPPVEPIPPPGPPPAGQMPPYAPADFTEAPKRRISTPVLIAIIVLVLVMVAGLAVGIIVPIKIASQNAKKTAQRRTCQANQRTIEAAIEEYAAMSPDENYPSSLNDLKSEGVLRSIPTCPSGNKEYIWVEGGIGTPPSISCPNRADHTL